MRLLMIVSTADDIFIYYLSKWLKKMMDISIDVIELNDSSKSNQKYSFENFDKVITMPQEYFFMNIPFVRGYTYSWDKSRKLRYILRGCHYDVIHCHYIFGIYANCSFLKTKCDKLYFTFWGGELERSTYLKSHTLFKRKFSKVLCQYSDGLVNSSLKTASHFQYKGKTPLVYYGAFGSAALEILYALGDCGNKEEYKLFWGMPIEKITVQIGYSGRASMRYIEVIEELMGYEELKDKVHLVAPMTRGATKEYVDQVEALLEKSGYTYTLLKDKFLTEAEVAKLRLSVDVVLQMAVLDGFSRSIVECLCAGSVLVYGEWLGYDIKFKDDGFEGIGVSSINEACFLLKNIVDNPKKYDRMTDINQKRGRGRYLWSECIKDWVAVYKGTAKPL